MVICFFWEALPNEQWRITDYDPASETFIPLCDSEGLNGAPVHGLVYDPWRDRVLVESGEEVLALSAGNACEVVTYLPLLVGLAAGRLRRMAACCFCRTRPYMPCPPCRRRRSGPS